MFYEDQHKLVAYLERTGAAFECKSNEGKWVSVDPRSNNPRICTYHHLIRPVLRYGLPSHLQPYKYNPRDPGEGYRVPTKKDLCNQPHERWSDGSNAWVKGAHGDDFFSHHTTFDYRLHATVPWPDWEAGAKNLSNRTQAVDNQQQTPGAETAKDARIAELEALPASQPDDLRALGWSVAVHNDYKLNGVFHTFWLFTNDQGQAIKGEGLTDADALNQIRAKLALDPLADLLKSHGVAVTPELTAALNAWKGVDK